MDFFDTIYLDNSIKNYCIAGGTILLMLVFKRYLSRYIATLIFGLTRRIWKNVEKKNFIDLVVEPLEWFLLILIAVFSIDKLNFPAAWHYNIYRHSTEEILDRAGIGIIIIAFTWFMLRIIDFIAMVLEEKAAHTADKTDDQLIVFFRDFLKVLIAIIGILLLIKACFNQPIGNLLTSLSIVGAVLALAAKESLENLIASFIIFFDKPFATGDFLKVNTVTGTVERIGLRSTRIRTPDKTLVTVPNKQMVDSVVDNWSMRTQRRAEVKLDLLAGTSTEVLLNFIAAAKKILAEKTLIVSFTVYLSELSKNGLLVTTEYFTGPLSLDEFNQLKEEMNISLKKLLDENNLSMIPATNTVTIINEPRID